MLARRFTIVCLLTTLFGMVLAIIVAEAGRQATAREIHGRLPCFFNQNNPCRF